MGRRVAWNEDCMEGNILEHWNGMASSSMMVALEQLKLRFSDLLATVNTVAGLRVVLHLYVKRGSLYLNTQIFRQGQNTMTILALPNIQFMFETRLERSAYSQLAHVLDTLGSHVG